MDNVVKAIGEEQIKKFIKILQEYKDGKKNLEFKIIANEQFWKLRHWDYEDEDGRIVKRNPATAWLWNTIVSKHADMMDSYPEPSILPRESDDEQEAETLSSILPVILEQNDFKQIYDDVCWYYLRQGAGIFGIFWDNSTPLGDIAIKKVDALNLFWQPGITNIQNSRYLFHTELIDSDIIKSQYPELENVNLSEDGYVAKYLYDDNVNTSDKCTVVDVYYKKKINGKTVLHYCKFTGTHVLFATENETEPQTDSEGNIISEALSETGWYNHGKYPFVFCSLYDVEGTPFGYGFTDIFKDTQISIDEINGAIVKNTKEGARRRIYVSDRVNCNEEELTNIECEVVHCTGDPGDGIKEIVTNPLSSIYVNFLNNQISMLKETSGNRDVNNGGTQSGVTAASAIAALQEQGNKGSRDIVSHMYEAYRDICYQVIELIRQFYDAPRKFRITGTDGKSRYASYNNSNIKPIYQGNGYGFDMGYRVPEFDIDVKAAKQTSYSKMAQNELMLQFYQLGFFNPQQATMTIACMKGMDFQGKNEIMKTIEQNGTILSMFMQLYQTAIGLASRFEPMLVPALQQIGVQAGVVTNSVMPSVDSDIKETDPNGNVVSNEHPWVQRARENAQNTSPA